MKAERSQIEEEGLSGAPSAKCQNVEQTVQQTVANALLNICSRVLHAEHPELLFER